MTLRFFCISIFIFSCLFFCSCANVKEVNSFAVLGHQLMEVNKFTDYGYFQYARDSADIYHPMPAYLRDVDCNCAYAQKLDTVLSAECQVLSAYFTTLAVFTDPKSAIAVKPLGAAMPAGTYGQLTITDRKQVLQRDSRRRCRLHLPRVIKPGNWNVILSSSMIRWRR